MSNFNMNDFAGELFGQKKEVSKMKKGDKNCRYLNLYPEDFAPDTWKQVCDSVGVGYGVKEIAIFYDKTMTKTGGK